MRSFTLGQSINLVSKKINRSVWLQMICHAETEYPEECCGVLLSSLTIASSALEWQPCHNLQNLMHQLDPHHFPRDAKLAYIINPDEWQFIHRRIEAGEVELSLFYHSHIDTPAYFSDEDQRHAVWEEQALFPSTIHLVFSIIQGELDHWKAFEWDSDVSKFVEVSCGKATDTYANFSG
jgi:[CysO sulfur-carrier protein]-S-L-cysteine hydrolase